MQERNESFLFPLPAKHTLFSAPFINYAHGNTPQSEKATENFRSQHIVHVCYGIKLL